MNQEIEIPEGVDVKIDGNTVKVSGEKGQIERTFKHFYNIDMELKDGKFVVSTPSQKRRVKVMIGTILAHTKNMIKGVTKGFTYKMKVVYSHFPVTVQTQGNKVLVKNFIGEKKPREAKIMGKDTKVELQGKDLIIKGINKESVGQTMGNIEQACRIIGYDRRVFQDGIYFVGEVNG